MEKVFVRNRIDDMASWTDDKLLKFTSLFLTDEAKFAAACLLMASESNERQAEA